MNDSRPQPGEFDRYAGEYDQALARGISVSGEDKDFFAKGRVAWLARCLRRLDSQPRRVLDYGCGTGSATPFLVEAFQVDSLTGVDVSAQSIEIAMQVHGSKTAQFMVLEKFRPEAGLDLVFCNGVFHHIPPGERPAAIDFIAKALRSKGLFAFWENNPWNPGTRYVMSRIPFDRDAITLSPPEARRLLRAGGFEILRTDFQFVFPRVLGWFRRFETALSPVPIGAQYQVLCRKP
jgi:SAM-dependent methyltransferase